MSARLAARIEHKIPTPGSEEALRRLIEGIRGGAPNYEEMGPAFAQVMQLKLPYLKPIAVQLGEIRSIEFQGLAAKAGTFTAFSARTVPRGGESRWDRMERSWVLWRF